MALLKHKRFWIFDLDGTLTVPCHDFDEIREQLGIAPGKFILEAIKEMPTEEGEKTYEKLQNIEFALAEDAQPQPGVVKCLSMLQERGCELGILTRNGEGIAHVTLAACGLAEFFKEETIIGRESCPPKPDPAGVNHFLHLWDAEPAETIVAGDYLFDLEAAHNAAVESAHFQRDSSQSWPDFTDYVYHDYGHLMQQLR